VAGIGVIISETGARFEIAVSVRNFQSHFPDFHVYDKLVLRPIRFAKQAALSRPDAARCGKQMKCPVKFTFS
jgi:hypothetical protein